MDRRKLRSCIPFEEIQRQIDEVHKGNIKLNQETYINTKHKCECKCEICGHIWTPNVRDIIRGHGCPQCAIVKHKQDTFNKFADAMNIKFNGRYSFDFKDYISKLDLMKIYDNETQKYIYVTPKSLEAKRLPKENVNFSINKLKRIENFIEKANDIFNGNFEYPNIYEEYENKYSKITVYCIKHKNYFKIAANKHLQRDNGGCKECFKEWFENNKKITLSKWIEECSQIHNGKYTYNEVKKLGNNFKLNIEVPIMCPKHGLFIQLASSHYHGKGCNKCAHELVAKKRTFTHDDFISRAREIHGNKYKYGAYNGLLFQIDIICPIHGLFKQVARDHLQGCGCPECGKERARQLRMWSTDKFIEEAIKVHGNKYIYTQSQYDGMTKPVEIICPIHGSFMQSPVLHIFQGCGCSKCSESKLERSVRLLLESNNIEYIYEKGFEWLKFKRDMTVDFYLPKYNLAIECQGEQHFHGGWSINEEVSKTVQERDIVKRQQCSDNGVELVYFLSPKYEEFVKDLQNKYFTNAEDLINYIKSK